MEKMFEKIISEGKKSGKSIEEKSCLMWEIRRMRRMTCR